MKKEVVMRQLNKDDRSYPGQITQSNPMKKKRSVVQVALQTICSCLMYCCWAMVAACGNKKSTNDLDILVLIDTNEVRKGIAEQRSVACGATMRSDSPPSEWWKSNVNLLTKKLNCMPIPIAAIAAGSQIAGSIANPILQGIQNRKSRKFQKEMYERQRTDALSDWTMQNEYNHPSSQMARLREAGLNPNLVYGHGADATSSSNVRSSSPDAPHTTAPQIDTGQITAGLMAFHDIEVKKAQVDNLRVQNTVSQQEALLKAAQVLQTTAQTEKTSTDTAQGKFDLSLAQELKSTSVEAAKANLNKTLADTQMTLDENERRAAMQAPTLQKAAEEVLNLRLSRSRTSAEIAHIKQQIVNLQKDERLKELDIQLKRLGIQPSDNIVMRMLGRILGDGSPTVNKIREGYKDTFSKPGVSDLPWPLNPILPKNRKK